MMTQDPALAGSGPVIIKIKLHDGGHTEQKGIAQRRKNVKEKVPEECTMIEE